VSEHKARAGKRDRRVTLRARTPGRDAHGQPIETWTDVATLWAGIEPLRGTQYFAAAQVQTEITARIRIPWQPDVMPTMQVHDIAANVTYDIVAVIDPSLQRRDLELMCKQLSQAYPPPPP
jgi:SPP1 family predicted phage head-tail adaptor